MKLKKYNAVKHGNVHTTGFLISFLQILTGKGRVIHKWRLCNWCSVIDSSYCKLAKPAISQSGKLSVKNSLTFQNSTPNKITKTYTQYSSFLIFNCRYKAIKRYISHYNTRYRKTAKTCCNKNEFGAIYLQKPIVFEKSMLNVVSSDIHALVESEEVKKHLR